MTFNTFRKNIILFLPLICLAESFAFSSQENISNQQSKRIVLLSQNSIKIARTPSATTETPATTKQQEQPIKNRRSTIKKAKSIKEPQYENCKGKDIYKLNSEFQDTALQKETEATGSCIDCFTASAPKFSSLDDIEQTLHEIKNRTTVRTRTGVRTVTEERTKRSPYQAFKDQLRIRVLGQVKTKIARTQILQKCAKTENIEQEREWFTKRFPKVDWPLMKALCEEKKKGFHSSIEKRWSDMRISRALTFVNPGQIVTSRPNLSFPLSHEVSDFSSMSKLTPEEQQMVKERWAEHLSKVPLDKLSPEQLKTQIMEGKALRQVGTKNLQEMRKAAWELNKQSRDRYRKHMDEMPLMGYMKTGDPENVEDMDQAFSKYIGHLDDLLEKVEDKDVDMALLLRFDPLVEGLLKDNEGYCLVAEGARLKSERDGSLKKWGLVTAGVVAAAPCFMTAGMLCLGLGTLVGAIGYKEAKEVSKETLERFLTGKDFETMASLAEKDREAFWTLALLPTVAWGTTVGTSQAVKEMLKRANSGSFDKLRARLYPRLSTSQVRTTPLKMLFDRSIDEAEKTLKLSKVVKTEPVGDGVNNPSLITLEDGTKAIWKPRQNKLHSNYRAEVLAYELDRKFGFNLVPPTVERTIHGKKGSLQLYREHESRDFKIKIFLGEKRVSPESAAKTEQDLKKQEVFDFLIENTDRKRKDIVITRDGRIIPVHKNYLISPEGNVISIDNGIGFTVKQKGYRQEVLWFKEELSAFLELDESKTIIENIRGSLTVEFEEEIADYLGKEDAAYLMERMRSVIRYYDYEERQ